MPEIFRGFDPREHTPVETYRLLLHCVAPRPIAFTSTVSEAGQPNLAPFSYFMAGGANPPSVIISPTTTRDGQMKDTLVNIKATGEYVINVVTYKMREQMNVTSGPYPYGESEWEKCGLTPVDSVNVKPARVSESPLAIECKLHTIVQHGDGPLGANYVIGEVVYFHISEDLFDETETLDARRIDYISRMGADWYGRVNADSMFEMGRP